MSVVPDSRDPRMFLARLLIDGVVCADVLLERGDNPPLASGGMRPCQPASVDETAPDWRCYIARRVADADWFAPFERWDGHVCRSGHRDAPP